ncbi:3-hydroxyisobutyrate dehydrogenase, mitochondrial [Leptinotarsa decemlineata]|uniref:3-hydroxyisobutyrate dehydrogenase, mitochondrial n=1 Tax=Leptinotarsa decemlineata TaxID=7539 RepID=UPI000C2518E5|nr:3-hydroxyisobutyrate dehydrogenase, mitochondrial [Leptinotarsa decemlineata]
MSFAAPVRLFVRNVQTRNSSNVAFIGLGQMGKRMAANLISKGQSLKVYDTVPAAAASVKGAQQCGSAEEAAKDANIVITMLPNGDIVKETLLGEKGILKGIPKKSILVDCSTIEPQMAKELSTISQKNSIRFIDAPVSGGVTGAQAGTLTFMTGGQETDVKEVEPFLLKMGAKIFHCGNIGAGQTAKLCNNLILAITMIGTCEAMNLGVNSGLDPKLLTAIVNVSTGRSWSSDTYNPVPGVMPNVPSSNNYEGGFSVPLIAKDLGLAERAALNSGSPLPLGALAHQLYRALLLNGYEEKDFSVVYKFLKGKK